MRYYSVRPPRDVYVLSSLVSALLVSECKQDGRVGLNNLMVSKYTRLEKSRSLPGWSAACHKWWLASVNYGQSTCSKINSLLIFHYPENWWSMAFLQSLNCMQKHTDNRESIRCCLSNLNNYSSEIKGRLLRGNSFNQTVHMQMPVSYSHRKLLRWAVNSFIWGQTDFM